MVKKRAGIDKRSVLILVAVLIWTGCNVSCLAASDNPVFCSYNILYQKNYNGHLIDSLSDNDDNEKIIQAWALASLGEKKKAIKELSGLKENYIQAAALYHYYGENDKAKKIVFDVSDNSDFGNLTAAYLLAVTSGHNDSITINRWQELLSSPVNIFNQKARFEIAGSYYQNGIIDSAMILVNNISPDALSINDKTDYFFLKTKLFVYFQDYSGALDNLKNALSIRYIDENKKQVVSFAVNSLYPHLDDRQTLELVKIFKKNRLYNKAIKLLENIESSDSTDLALGLCYLSKKKYSKASRIFKKLTSSADGKIRIEAEYSQGICYFRRGLRVKGAAKLLNFADKYPNSDLASSALFVAGDFYQKSDLYKSANIFQKLVDDYPDSKFFNRALFLLGRSYEKLGLKQKALWAFSKYRGNDETVDLFDFWLYKVSPEDSLYLKKIINRKYPTFYNIKAGEILNCSKQDSNFTYDEFIENFIAGAQKFLSWRVPRGHLKKEQILYADSLCYYGLVDEASRQLYYIYRKNSNPHIKLAVLKKARDLHLDRVFFDILDELKIELKRLGLSYSNDTWMRLNYPVLYKGLLTYNSGEIDPYLALAVIRRESRFDPYAISGVGATGLMQLMESTAAQMNGTRTISPESLFDPGYNVKLGFKYLRWLKRRLPNDEMVIAAYNAGPTAAKRWRKQAGTDIETYIETIGYDQSRNYTRWVMGDYLWYKKIWPIEFNE